MKNVRYLVIDVDGTLTDGKIYMGDNGEIFKAFDIKDGYGIRNILIPTGIIPIIITGRTSKILENRCKELGILDIHQGIDNKVQKLNEILLSKNATYGNVAYIGDDINDLECMELIKNAKGVIGCPADAVMSVKQIADYVSSKAGGNGAVREFIEWIVNKFNKELI